MKKILFIPTALLIAAALLGGCDKLKKEIKKATFQGQVSTVIDYMAMIPEIPVDSAEGTIEDIVIPFNMDSVVKATTNNIFTLSDIGAINFESLTVSIENPDSTVNFANFEYLRLVMKTNNVQTPVVCAYDPIPDAYSDLLYFPLDKSLDLHPYAEGKILTMSASSKTRRKTTRNLYCRMIMKVKMNPK